jgi:putative spermidine/putrescine transport system permease protein
MGQGHGLRMTTTLDVGSTAASTPPARGGGRVRVRQLTAALGVVPFLAYLVIFLVIPTLTVVVGAFVEEGRPSLANLRDLGDAAVFGALANSLALSAVTAVIGGVVGALLAYAVVTGPADGLLRRLVTSICGVLAQFGGVTLAFAFIATLGISGVVSVWLDAHLGTGLTSSTWLFGLKGLVLVYAYFQIPLMVIVFLPALDGIRVQWREAAENLGATTWQYWRLVGLPLLTPAFLGSVLLLFANAFAAYATAAALVSQGNPIIPLWIRSALTSEIVLGHANFAYALALEMIVIVALVMTGYSLLLKRTSRWLG